MPSASRNSTALGRLALLGGIVAVAACSRLSAPGGDASSSGSGGTSGHGGGTFEEVAGADHPALGLVSLVPAGDRLRVDWRATSVDELDLRLALFIGTAEQGLFVGPGLEVSPEDGSHVFDGLLPSTPYYVGLGVELATAEPGFLPTGPVLSGSTFQPVYANPAADPALADGLTPETAYPNLFVAVLSAFLSGAGQGGNVWLSEGSFEEVSLPLLAGVSLFGGFGADFDLEARDPELQRSVLKGLAGSSVLLLEEAQGVQVVDGLEIDGQGASSNGIDLDRTPAHLRGLTIRGCSRGMRLRAPHAVEVTDVSMTHCLLVDNLLEGLSLDGPYSLSIEACSFQTNGQEGLEFGPWIAPEGTSVSLNLRDCRFSGNAFEGLDIDLTAPAGTVGPGGSFEVVIEDSLFEQNGTSGLLIDLDYEAQPEWSAAIVLRGCESRANAQHGVALDLDAPASCLIHRLLSTSNVRDGISVTSESLPGMLTVSASALVANLGAGLRSSLGNYGVALSHCVIAGNVEAGMLSTHTSATAASCVAHLQPAAYGAARLAGSLELDLQSTPFVYAPIEYRSVLGVLGDSLQLDGPLAAGAVGACEVASDGVVRLVQSSSGNLLELSPELEEPLIPSRLALFDAADSVEEDYRPSASSPLVGAGMAPPSGLAVDAGPHGGASGGAPGVDELLPTSLFHVSATEPAWRQTIETGSEFRVHFQGGTPSELSIERGVRLVDAVGLELPLEAQVLDDVLVVAAPPGGWASGDALELHTTFLMRDKQTHLIPVVLPIGAH